MTEPTERDADQKWNDLITRALAPPVDRALPSGFAAMIAARAEAATQATIDRRERVIQAALFACLALTALATVTAFVGCVSRAMSIQTSPLRVPSGTSRLTPSGSDAVRGSRPWSSMK